MRLDPRMVHCCELLFDIFNAAAETGQVCPNRFTLGADLGMAHDRVVLAHATLEHTGRIRTERNGNGMRVQIVATGKWTAWSGHRRLAGTVIKRRRCLRCNQMFDSSGAGHRICCRGERRVDEVSDNVLGQPAPYWW
jgi:hypothetical protein